jgi:hypothetical protein
MKVEEGGTVSKHVNGLETNKNIVPKPKTTVLARASSNLLICFVIGSS